MPSDRTVYVFRKGQRLQLDGIYHIQSLGTDAWWEPDPPDDDMADNVVITRSVRITVTVTDLDVTDAE